MTDVMELKSLSELPEVLASIFDGMQDDFESIVFDDALKTKVVPAMAKTHEDYFNNEAGPVGDWAPLAPATVKKKDFDTILIENNNMRSSLLFTGASDHIEDISQAGLTWGTDDEKAAFHQYGTSKIPARPFVGFNDDLLKEVTEIIADAAVEGLKKKNAA